VTCDSVHPVSTTSTRSVAVGERSTTEIGSSEASKHRSRARAYPEVPSSVFT
jgi:hypothetical protein